MPAVVKVEINPKKYGRLLVRTLPSIIQNDEDHERMLSEIERLMDKGDDRLSPEEEQLLKLMVRLVQDYEDTYTPIEDASPQEVLQHLMEERGLRQADLLPIFGSRGYISDIVNGKRGISKEYARKLGDFFNVSAELFI